MKTSHVVAVQQWIKQNTNHSESTDDQWNADCFESWVELSVLPMIAVNATIINLIFPLKQPMYSGDRIEADRQMDEQPRQELKECYRETP